jgi:hypothetical protein
MTYSKEPPSSRARLIMATVVLRPVGSILCSLYPPPPHLRPQLSKREQGKGWPGVHQCPSSLLPWWPENNGKFFPQCLLCSRLWVKYLEQVWLTITVLEEVNITNTREQDTHNTWNEIWISIGDSHRLCLWHCDTTLYNRRKVKGKLEISETKKLSFHPHLWTYLRTRDEPQIKSSCTGLHYWSYPWFSTMHTTPRKDISKLYLHLDCAIRLIISEIQAEMVRATSKKQSYSGMRPHLSSLLPV